MMKSQSIELLNQGHIQFMASDERAFCILKESHVHHFYNFPPTKAETLKSTEHYTYNLFQRNYAHIERNYLNKISTEKKDLPPTTKSMQIRWSAQILLLAIGSKLIEQS